MPVMSILRDRLGAGALEIAIKRGDIEFVPMEVVKGYSAENCFFIVDEAEDLTYDEAKKVMTRQGKGCHMVLAGDIQQSELKERSGLKILTDIAAMCPFIDLGVINFDNKSDIVRGEACKNWIIGFERYEAQAQSKV
ncbi:PhoH-like protein [compost metagenome]